MFFLLFTLCFFAIDQVSKKFVTSYMLPRSSLAVIDELIYPTPVKNKGLFIGLSHPPPLIAPLFTILIVGALVLLAFTKIKERTGGFVALIVGGAGGNLWDRLIKGGVVDFIHVGFWPIFNLADIFITVGVILFCFNLFLFKGKCIE